MLNFLVCGVGWGSAPLGPSTGMTTAVAGDVGTSTAAGELAVSEASVVSLASASPVTSSPEETITTTTTTTTTTTASPTTTTDTTPGAAIQEQEVATGTSEPTETAPTDTAPMESPSAQEADAGPVEATKTTTIHENEPPTATNATEEEGLGVKKDISEEAKAPLPAISPVLVPHPPFKPKPVEPRLLQRPTLRKELVKKADDGECLIEGDASALEGQKPKKESKVRRSKTMGEEVLMEGEASAQSAPPSYINHKRLNSRPAEANSYTMEPRPPREPKPTREEKKEKRKDKNKDKKKGKKDKKKNKKKNAADCGFDIPDYLLEAAAPKPKVEEEVVQETEVERRERRRRMEAELEAGNMSHESMHLELGDAVRAELAAQNDHEEMLLAAQHTRMLNHMNSEDMYEKVTKSDSEESLLDLRSGSDGEEEKNKQKDAAAATENVEETEGKEEELSLGDKDEELNLLSDSDDDG
jgi:hypothetical protein